MKKSIEVGSRVKALREDKKLSIADVAEVGLSGMILEWFKYLLDREFLVSLESHKVQF